MSSENIYPSGSGAQALEDSRQQLEDRIKQFTEVIPTDRNFDFDIQTQNDEISLDVSLVRDDGQRVLLNDFLAPGFRFRNGIQCVCLKDVKWVEFPKSELQYRNSVLNLFHEIGHSHQPLLNDSLLDKLRLPLDMYRKYFGLLRRGGVEGLSELSNDFLLPTWYINKTATTRTRDEQDAWFYSLKQLQLLDKDGFKVLAGFVNPEEISEYIGLHLLSYDLLRITQLALAGEVKAEEYNQLYFLNIPKTL